MQTSEHKIGAMRTTEIWINSIKQLIVLPAGLALLTILLVAPACSKDEASVSLAEKSIAVLPFFNASSHQQDAYFAGGIQEDLISSLSKIRDLKVISRSSVMPYKDAEKSLTQISEELGVRFLLEGSTQRSGDQVRINVQLIDGMTDKHIWAETYSRELKAGNVFAIQAEISKEIAQQLEGIIYPSSLP